MGLGGHVNILQGGVTTARGHTLVDMCWGMGGVGSVGGEWVLVVVVM